MGRARTTKVYWLPKRDTYVVVAQLSPEFTARIVDRWQELEDAQSASSPQLPNFSDPVAAARAWADEAEQKQVAQAKAVQLENKVEELAPKAAVADQIANLDGLVDVGHVAQLVGTGRNRLFRFLREQGWVIGHQRNRPYQRVVEAGLMDTKTREITKPDGTIIDVITPYLTAKGAEKLAELWGAA